MKSMHPTSKLLAGVSAWVLLLASSHANSGSVVLNITIGDLFNAAGTSQSDLLPVNALCLLVADIDGNGFQPVTTQGWATGDDKVVSVFDLQHPNGYEGFPLTSGSNPAPGLFSQSLQIDLSQFGAYSTPIPIELLWFADYQAATTDPKTTLPAAGASYGEFTRAIPKYTDFGTSPWVIPITSGGNYTLDPFATSDLEGSDPAALGVASFFVIPEPASGVLLGMAAVWLSTVRRRRTLAGG